MRVGELVYIPSNVNLIKVKRDESLIPQKHLKTNEPISVLVTEISEDRMYLGVHFRGEVWYVNWRDVYED